MIAAPHWEPDIIIVDTNTKTSSVQIGFLWFVFLLLYRQFKLYYMMYLPLFVTVESLALSVCKEITIRMTGKINRQGHYNDVIMTTIASQITSLTVVYSTVYSDADQRKHQSSASLAFVWGIHRDRWIPLTKGQLRGKCFHQMTSSWIITKQDNTRELCAQFLQYVLCSKEQYRKWRRCYVSVNASPISGHSTLCPLSDPVNNRKVVMSWHHQWYRLCQLKRIPYL